MSSGLRWASALGVVAVVTVPLATAVWKGGGLNREGVEAAAWIATILSFALAAVVIAVKIVRQEKGPDLGKLVKAVRPGVTSSLQRPLVVAAAGIGALALAAIYLWLPRPFGPDEPCVPLEVNSSIESGKVEALEASATAYSESDRRPGGRCVEMNVTGTSSGRAMQALEEDEWDPVPGEAEGDTPEPQVWLPTSSLWLDVLGQRGNIDGLPANNETESIAASPLVIAMPEPMAEQLGWPEEQISWRQVMELSAEPTGWASMGRPEWGAFTFGKDEADESTSGLAATVAAFYAATGTMNDLQLQDLQDNDAQNFVRGVEAGVHHYAPDAIEFLEELAGYDDRGEPLDYVSAVVLEEQLIHEYNQGEYNEDKKPPSEPLVALYPTDGTLMLDHPYVILPGADDEQRAAAEDFLDYLKEQESRDELTEAGFRYQDDEDEPWLLTGEAADEMRGLEEIPSTSLLRPPSAEVVEGILDLWGTLRKPADILLVLDTSGSMAQETGEGLTRLEAMQDAAHQALDNLEERHSDRHNVGLWVFPSSNEEVPYEEVLAPAPFKDIEDELRAEIDDLEPDGGTPLYRTARESHDFMADEFGPDGSINAIVLLTDGQNEDPLDNDLAALLEDVDANSREQDGQPSVGIFSIAFGEESSFDVMQDLSDATDPDAVDEVFIDVLSNF